MIPLLSIVVPTKNRYTYLKELVVLIESYRSAEIELIVQDNSDDNSEFTDFITKGNFSCLKYFYRADRLSQAENSDWAIKNSTGEYVCFIGDDDGVTRHIIPCVKWMKDNDIDAMTSSLACYKWPDYKPTLTSTSNFFSYTPFQGNYYIADIDKILHKMLSIGFVNLGDLPKVYQGVVRRSLLDKIYAIGKTYHPGPSPDMACAVSLCFFVKKYAILDFPIIITGASIHSGGSECVRKFKNRLSEIENVPFLPADAKKKWEKSIPNLWSVETVWPESAIKALKYCKQEHLIKRINFEYLLAYFIVFHIPYRAKAIALSKNKVKLSYYVFRILIFRYSNGIINLLSRLPVLKNLKKEKYMLDFQNITEVEHWLAENYPVFPDLH